jgi:hypothetical protein
MKLRSGWMLATVGAALFLSGCATHTATVPPSPARNYNLTVVESSPNLTLSPQDTEKLRTYVLQYLLTQGPVRNDSYSVRIDFPPEAPGAAPAYLVVQLTAEPQPTYTLITAYPEPWYYDPYFWGYSYFGLFGYAYYDQFYYNHDHYYRPIPPPAHYAGPHPPGYGHPDSGKRHYPAPGATDVKRPHPNDGTRNAGDRRYPTSANPDVARSQPGSDRNHRPPPAEVTQRNDPGRRSGGNPPSGSSAPVAQTDHNRGGGGHTAPSPSHSPPPARESAPVQQTAQAYHASSGKGDLSPEKQER